jgi:hypothetical protein
MEHAPTYSRTCLRKGGLITLRSTYNDTTPLKQPGIRVSSWWRLEIPNALYFVSVRHTTLQIREKSVDFDEKKSSYVLSLNKISFFYNQIFMIFKINKSVIKSS